MKEGRFTGPLLFWGIVTLMSVAMLLLVWGVRTSQRHEEEVARRALEGMLNVAVARIDGVAAGYANDLRREAAFLRQFDSIPLRTMLERWIPLMTTRWAITEIHQSNMYGEELSLQRDEPLWSLRVRDTTISRERLIIRPRSLAEEAGRMGLRWVEDPPIDPREAIWFSQALEDRSGEPVWSSEPGTAAHGDHHLSLLLRPREGGKPFRVLAFTIDARLALSAEGPGVDPYYTAVFLLDSDGRDLQALEDSSGATDLRKAAIAQWQERKGRSMVTSVAGERRYHALVMPYALNGEVIHLGAVMDDELIGKELRAERIALTTGGIVLVLLGAMLLWAYIRRRRESRLLRLQRKHTMARERELAKALGERDMLDREVHHRVKNNLQVVSSLLNLQAQRIPDGAARTEFIRGKRRIDAIALVHHKLYGMPDLRSIKLQDLFQQLADAIAGLHEPASRSVSHAVDTAGIVSDPDTAIELGIILCELLDNCHQHAFPFATGGHIDIEVRPMGGDLFRLEVRDNGKGLDANDLRDPSKLGLEIVDALAGQLDGNFAARPRVNAPGTMFEVRFHKRPPQG